MPPPPELPNPLAGPGDYITNPVHSSTYPYVSPLKTNLIGKCVFITGASKGIGLATAHSFARAGASFLALGARSSMQHLLPSILDSASSAKRPAPHVLLLELDINSQSSIEAAASATEKQFGRLDILINNAGVLGSTVKVGDSDPEGWWSAFTTNVRGPYLLIRSLLPLLLKADVEDGMKQILNVTSVGAWLTNAGFSGYQSSKTALLRLTEFVAEEYRDQGLIAIGVHPGNCLTNIVGMGEGVSEEVRPVFVDEPELAANTMVWLVGERKEWLSGRYVNCTWDMEQFLGMREEIINGGKLKVSMSL